MRERSKALNCIELHIKLFLAVIAYNTTGLYVRVCQSKRINTDPNNTIGRRGTTHTLLLKAPKLQVI